MKRFLLAFFLILSCLFFASNKLKANAESNEIHFDTLYPDNIVDYADLSDISKLAIGENYIAYSQNNTNMHLYNINTKETRTIENLSNIIKVKIYKNTLIIITQDSVYYSNNIETVTRETLNRVSSISFTTLQSADIYISNDKIFIGFVDNNTFKLYEFNLNFTTSKSNPTKTIQSLSFNDTYLIAINDKTAYIVSNPLFPTMYIQDYSSNSPITASLQVPYQTLDTFYFNNTEYIITFTNENLQLLNSDCEVLSNISKNEFNQFLKITDIDFYNNLIYVSDNIHNSIDTYSISETNQLKSENTLICASNKNLGRFNDANNIISSGNKLIVSNYSNSRIEIITHTTKISENNETINTYTPTARQLPSEFKPKSVTLDNLGNIFFVVNTETHSQIIKYNHNASNDEDYTTYEKNGLNNIGYISDITITNDNSLYMLDYTNNKLLYLSNNGIEEKITLDFGLSENAKIEYIKKLNLFVILNNNVLHVLSNNTNTTRLNSISMPGTSITCDLDSVYILDNNQIKVAHVNIDDSTYTLSVSSNKITDNHISNFNSIHFDISTRVMYGFNHYRQCIEYFTPSLIDKPFNLYDISEQTPLTPESTLIPTELINNTIIYDYPYFLGNSYNYNGEITNAFIVDQTSYPDYYRIIFNNNGKLASGFIPSTSAPLTKQQKFIDRRINVVTINQEVPIYKYPTLLQYNNSSLKITKLTINTNITLCAESPITIDGKKFYKYQDNNIVGFIFNADVVLNENTHIEYLKNANATIKTYDQEPTAIYNEDKTTKIIDINNLARVYIEDYDKNSEYTKVLFKTKDLQTIEGYVLTKYIQPDELDNTKIVIICIIIFAFILLAIVIVSYLIIKKKKN